MIFYLFATKKAPVNVYKVNKHLRSSFDYFYFSPKGSPTAQAPTIVQAKTLASVAIELLHPRGKEALAGIQEEFKQTLPELAPPN